MKDTLAECLVHIDRWCVAVSMNNRLTCVLFQLPRESTLNHSTTSSNVFGLLAQNGKSVQGSIACIAREIVRQERRTSGRPRRRHSGGDRRLCRQARYSTVPERRVCRSGDADAMLLQDEIC